MLDQEAERLRQRRPDWIVHFAHMELAAPTLEQAFDACVSDGAREIVVHPYFLAPGRHSTDDIPRLFTTETFCKMVVRAQHAAAATTEG